MSSRCSPALIAALVATFACGLTDQARAAVFTNGSFETGDFTDNGSGFESLSPGATDIDGWTVDADNIAWLNNSSGFTASDGAFSGPYGYFFGAPFGGVVQVATTAPTQSYLLGFDVGTLFSNGVINAAVSVEIDDAFADAFTNSSNPVSGDIVWQHFSLSFVSGAGSSTKIGFYGARGGDFIGLDNVTLDVADTAAVPEPASMAIWGLGALGCAIAGYRRRKLA